jgi:tRNA dimethylallyltransferase
MSIHHFILGPTASGKSALALELAELCGGVVCNMDAFQVYRGLDIGTGKPGADDRARVPHELFDIVDPLEAFSVADYLHVAEKVILAHPDRPLIWVGGTGLYYRTLRSGLAPAPATDPSVLAGLEAMPAKARVAEIQRVDPVWAASADLANPRRVIRALAVFRQTGRPLSAWHQQPVRPLLEQGRAWLLELQPGSLRARIDQRVETMWEGGWPEEVARLALETTWAQAPSARALGYLDILQWQREGGDPAAVRQRVATRTWQYARRQLTWFRRERNLLPIKLNDPFDSPSVAREILRTSVPALPLVP